MVYLMLAVAVVVIVQCVTKRKQQAESHKDAEDIPAVGEACSPDAQETRKKGGILPVLYICLILWLCGLALIGGAYKSKKESEAIKSQGNRATAYITGVSEFEVYDEDGDLRDVRDIYIAYELYGEAYNYVIKDAYMCASENDIGEPVEIYYDGENPAVITVPENVESKVSVKLPLGIVIFCIPTGLILFFGIRYRMEKRSRVNRDGDA